MFSETENHCYKYKKLIILPDKAYSDVLRTNFLSKSICHFEVVINNLVIKQLKSNS